MWKNPANAPRITTQQYNTRPLYLSYLFVLLISASHSSNFVQTAHALVRAGLVLRKRQ